MRIIDGQPTYSTAELVEQVVPATWSDEQMLRLALIGRGMHQAAIGSFLGEAEQLGLVEFRSARAARPGEVGYRPEYARLGPDTAWRQVRWTPTFAREVRSRNFVDPLAPPAPKPKPPWGARFVPFGGEVEEAAARARREKAEDDARARQARDASPVPYAAFVAEREARREADDDIRREVAELRAEVEELRGQLEALRHQIESDVPAQPQERRWHR